MDSDFAEKKSKYKILEENRKLKEEVSSLGKHIQHIEEENSLLKFLFDSIPNAVYSMDTKGFLFDCNKKFAILCDRDGEDLKGCNFYDIFPVISPEKLHASDVELMKEGKGTIEISAIQKGCYRNFLNRRALFHDKRGKIQGIAGFLIDITEQRNREKQLEQARQEAESLSRIKSSFIANISHEIRTPLNSLLGMIKLVIDTELNQEQREFLSLAYLSAKNLRNIINDILDLSKIESGKFHLKMEKIKIRKLLDNLVAAHAPLADEKGLKLDLSMGRDVPEFLLGDPDMLFHALINLVSNAIKFSDNGKISISVEKVNQDSRNIQLLFKVSDMGIGIPEKDQDSLFEDFWQSDSSMSKRFKGTGLGLAITKTLVEMMDGRIDVCSSPGKGSTFSFTAQFSIPEILENPVRRGGLKGKSILVAAGVNENWDKGISFFQRIEMDYRVVAKGEELKKELLANDNNVPYDIILICEELDDSDGFTVAEELPGLGLILPPIMMQIKPSSMATFQKIRHKISISSCILKPSREESVIKAIKNALGMNMEDTAAEDKAGEKIGKKDSEQIYSHCRVLLVEDDLINRKLGIAMLKRIGCQFETASNGQEAVDKFEPGKYDSILMDLQMPCMDGLEATRRIRAREDSEKVKVSIIAMTAYAMSGDRQRCLQAGMDDFISKPVDMDKLREKISQYAD